MKRIKLMADYQCFPVWEAGDGHFGNIDPQDLPISVDLTIDLANWARQYDETLNLDQPSKSGFNDEESELAFRRLGERLQTRLQNELDGEYVVDLFMGNGNLF